MKSLFKKLFAQISFASHEQSGLALAPRVQKRADVADVFTQHAQHARLIGLPQPLPLFRKRHVYDDVFDFNGPR